MRKFYEELIGFVPPRIQARTEIGSRVDPEGLELQKTSQLMLFGILLALGGDAGRLHAIAARRAGATWEELWAVAGLAYLFRGLPAANLGADIIQQLAAEERKG
ncbi:MAG: carboxymuconolactone decarboxylase family protein [Candidatus Rokubacteria bacterium]|nr:carboxymuconolactone decarboxylase family protein [Candidatus Rokubacteria bacterium]